MRASSCIGGFKMWGEIILKRNCNELVSLFEIDYGEEDV